METKSVDAFLLGVICTLTTLLIGSMLIFGQQILELIDGE
jgi:hypothetical protein